MLIFPSPHIIRDAATDFNDAPRVLPTIKALNLSPLGMQDIWGNYGQTGLNTDGLHAIAKELTPEDITNLFYMLEEHPKIHTLVFYQLPLNSTQIHQLYEELIKNETLESIYFKKIDLERKDIKCFSILKSLRKKDLEIDVGEYNDRLNGYASSSDEEEDKRSVSSKASSLSIKCWP